MQVSLEYEQVQVLLEVLQSSLKELRYESARADSHDFRQLLHHREEIVESVMSRLKVEERIEAV